MPYFRKVWMQGVRASLERLPKWREGAMRFVIQAALIFALLWFLPSLGIWQTHAKTGVITLAAIFGSLAVTFISDLMAAPAKIDRDQVMEIKSLREVIRSVNDENRAMEEVSELWQRGVALENSDKTEKEVWLDSVRGHLKAHFRPHVRHKLTKAESGGHGAVLALLDQLASNAPVLDYLGDWGHINWEPDIWKRQSKRYSHNIGADYVPNDD